MALHASRGGHRTDLTCKKLHIYTSKKKKLYVKLTYCDHPNKNVEHPILRITKVEFNKNKNNFTFTTFS